MFGSSHMVLTFRGKTWEFFHTSCHAPPQSPRTSGHPRTLWTSVPTGQPQKQSGSTLNFPMKNPSPAASHRNCSRHLLLLLLSNMPVVCERGDLVNMYSESWDASQLRQKTQVNSDQWVQLTFVLTTGLGIQCQPLPTTTTTATDTAPTTGAAIATTTTTTVLKKSHIRGTDNMLSHAHDMRAHTHIHTCTRTRTHTHTHTPV